MLWRAIQKIIIHIASKKYSSYKKDNSKLDHSLGAVLTSITKQWARYLWRCSGYPVKHYPYATLCTTSHSAVSFRKRFSLLCEFLLWHSYSSQMQCCCSVVSVTWACSELDVSLFLFDTWQWWHWNVAWTYWTSFPQVLEMTLNNRNNGWWTILEGFFFSDTGPDFSSASFTRHTSFWASRIVIRAPCCL